MKNKFLLLTILILSIFLLRSYSSQTNYIVLKDTILDTNTVVNEMVFDTLIINNGVKLTLARPDTSVGWKSGYNVRAYKLLQVNSGASVIGNIPTEGYLVVNGGKIINNSYRNAINNISLNLFGNDTIKGNPSTFINVLAGNNGRHIIIDTTVTFKGIIFEKLRTSIVSRGDTLILDDTARFKLNTDYAHIVTKQGGVVKRIISANDIGKIDTIPFGDSTRQGYGCWLMVKLNAATLGLNPYLQYEIIYQVHPQIGTATNYLKKYLKISGNDITNLDYDVIWKYYHLPTYSSVFGDSSKLKNAYQDGAKSWHTKNKVNTTNSTITLNNLSGWVEISALNGPNSINLSPAKNAINVATDSNIKIIFDQSVNSLDLSGIKVTSKKKGNIALSSVTLIDPLTLEIKHDLDTFSFVDTILVSIPEGAVSNLENITNLPLNWTFYTDLGVGNKKISKTKIINLNNPVLDNNLTITISDATNVGIKIIDMLGKVVLTENLENGNGIINLANLKSGIYFVEMVSGNNKTIKKIIKK